MPEKSDVLFLLSYLPPLSDFLPTLLDPPFPPKIGHHLCTFPNFQIYSKREKTNQLLPFYIRKQKEAQFSQCLLPIEQLKRFSWKMVSVSIKHYSFVYTVNIYRIHKGIVQVNYLQCTNSQYCPLEYKGSQLLITKAMFYL